MSLDVYLKMPKSKQPTKEKSPSGIFVRQGGRTIEITAEEWGLLHPNSNPIVFNRNSSDCDTDDDNDVCVFSSNITHNLGEMADKAGIYKCLWHPETLSITHANQMIEPLSAGLDLLKSNPKHFRKFDSPNGWGTYNDFVPWVEEYLEACKRFPGATVKVWR